MTRTLYFAQDYADGGVWVKKAPVMKAMVEENVLAEFCEGVEPADNEPVIVKQYASSFFGTSLASLLYTQGVDTVVIAGSSTGARSLCRCCPRARPF